VAKVIRPHQLQGANFRAEEPDGENEVDVRVFDLDHFEKKLALIVDMHCRPKGRAVGNRVMRHRVQQARRGLRWQPRDQQLGQAQVGQADRVREWAFLTLDVLNGPPVVGDDLPQGVQVVIGGAVGVVALPAHGMLPSVVVATKPASTHRQTRTDRAAAAATPARSATRSPTRAGWRWPSIPPMPSCAIRTPARRGRRPRREEIEWKESPWAQRETLISNDQVKFIVATYSITDARKQKFDFAGPCLLTGQSLPVKSDNTDIAGPESLQNNEKLSSVSGIHSGHTGIG